MAKKGRRDTLVFGERHVWPDGRTLMPGYGHSRRRAFHVPDDLGAYSEQMALRIADWLVFGDDPGRLYERVDPATTA